MEKLFFLFGTKRAEGSGKLRSILGGKGAGLADMTNAGIPVPPGFTISTKVCNLFYKNKEKFPKRLESQMLSYIKRLERLAGARFGDARNPLLVSVRSGAEVSMPGMMDTILNLGLNDRTVRALAKKTQDPSFAYDCYRRLIMTFGSVVSGIARSEFEELLEERKRQRGIKTDAELTQQDMEYLVERFKELYREKTGKDFPQSPIKQLRMARDAVFKSWNNPRAQTYRRLYNIPDTLGTAVNIQAMVFGNIGSSSGTGVGFTRNPATGENKFYGEYLYKAQGEDVVAGVRTPLPIERLQDDMPEVYSQLKDITRRLERYYRDVQDFEFTIQEGKLWMLQTRSGKRTGHAAVKIAVDMVEEGLLTSQEALLRVEPAHIQQLLHPIFDPQARKDFYVFAKGLDASPGAAAGRVVFDANTAVEWASKGERVILVRNETSPDDIHGMAKAKGVLTATGGMTSHAAVVGRQMGKPSVVGCSAIKVDEEAKRFYSGDLCVQEGDFISIDGTTGEVLLGDVPTKESEVLQVINGRLRPEDSSIYQDLQKLLSWADRVRRLGVRANADIPRDADIAIKFGAEGIGLCRTEHMFFAEDRIPIVQEMILAKSPQEIEDALGKLLPLQREDFKGLFRIMKGLPVTIRTLDPPLHEFLPKREELVLQIAQLRSEGKEEELRQKEKILRRVEELFEFNPMMGRRGCRLGITFPKITEMQARAMFEAACDVMEEGVDVVLEVMIPLVGDLGELGNQKELVDRVAMEVSSRRNQKIKYSVGTMIEVPRAALTADRIAQEASFFSFGTNDLTQMTYGFSRDDAGKFLPYYLENRILTIDPFVTIDSEGVGELIRIGVKKGRKTRKDLKIGICGEHGGEPGSIRLCHSLGLDYVSCSPYRIPVARLAAAQAVLMEKRGRR
jgi:pyruvate,orthophosphate dikinase